MGVLIYSVGGDGGGVLNTVGGDMSGTGSGGPYVTSALSAAAILGSGVIAAKE